MKKHVIAAALLSTLCAGAVMAQESPWLVRVRAVNLQSDNGSDGTLATLKPTINDKWLPDVDISYFFSPNVAAELVLTVPQKHTLYSDGTPIGTLKHLPPTLTAQYHFTNFQGFKPYVGAGLNYTRFSSVNIEGGAVTLDNNSFGLALQAGVDIPLTKQMSLNFDVKKVQIRTDVSTATGKLGQFKVDPWLVGVGLGWRF